MAKKRRQTGKKRNIPKKRLSRGSSPDLITYHGLAIVRAAKGGIETLIISDLNSARLFDLSPDELRLAEYVFQQAAPVRKCKAQSQNGQVRCINFACPHKCHLYKIKLPIPSDSPPDVEDLGENDRDWVDKEKGFGYICGCDGWEDS